MREIVIVIADLFLQGGADTDTETEAVTRAPAIAHLARFGERTDLPEGWRAWTARWLDLPQYARESPAGIAAATLASLPADRAVWLATPLHMVAGLTSLHVDRRSALRLPGAELEKLAASFAATFHGSEFELHPLGSGELLLSGPAALAPAVTTEPARMLLASFAEALPRGEGATALRRLSAEIEMWLHDHPLNEERARRGTPPVAALWLWGGGMPSIPRPATARELADAAYGSDPYVRGLWWLAGGETRPMPVDWRAVIGEPRAQRALGVVEVAELLQANALWRLTDAIAHIDRQLLAPSLAALHRGKLDRLVLLANDRSLAVRAADRWRFWRRKRTGLRAWHESARRAARGRRRGRPHTRGRRLAPGAAPDLSRPRRAHG